MAHNVKRAERMKSLSVADLRRIVAAKSLSSAAAAFELKRRGVDPV
jgi:hypothetical protein